MRDAERLRRLETVVAAIAAAGPPFGFVDRVLAELAEALGARAAELWALDPAGGRLELCGAHGRREARSTPASWPVDAGSPAGEAVLRNERLWIAGPAALARRYPGAPGLLPPGGGAAEISLAVLPVGSGGAVLGALGLWVAGTEPLAEADWEFATAVARQCGLALERSRLLDAERRARADAEEARRETERQRAGLVALFEQAPAFVFVLRGPELRIEICNPRFEALLGRTGLVGKTVREALPDYVDQYVPLWERVYRSGEPYIGKEVETIVHEPAGPRKAWFTFVLQAVRNEAGAITGVMNFGFEITEQMQARQAVAEANARISESLAVFDTFFDAAPVGMNLLDSNLRYVRVNRALAEINGAPVEAHVGRPLAEIVPGLAAFCTPYYEKALAGEATTDLLVEGRTPASPEEDHAFSVSFYPVRVGDRVLGAGTIVQDVTTRRRAEREVQAAVRRFAFLAEAGEVLASSLDYERTLSRLAHLAVPELGDQCIVDIVEGATIRRVAAAHVSPAKGALLEELRRGHPPTGDSSQPAARVLRTGKAELLVEVDADTIAAHTSSAAHADLIRRLGIRSHLAVPLVLRGAVLGVISVAVTESDRRYGPEDVTLATEVARRAALAIENAHLYATAQQELADRKRAETALRMSELRFRAVMEQSPLSTQILSRSGETLQVNRAWEELWGLTLDKIPGYNILADPQLEARGIAPFLRRAFAGQAVAIPAGPYDPKETMPEVTTHADSARWVRAFAYPIKDEEGAVREVVLIHEDVTAQVKAEQALRASEERLRLALDAAHMNVWEWDLVTNAVACSDNAQEFWGIHVGHVSAFAAAVHPDDLPAVQRSTERAIAGEAPYLAEARIVRPGRPLRWVQSRGRVDRDADGRALRLLGVTVDITELKEAEHSLRLLAEAGEALGSSLDYQATLDRLTRTVVPRMADWCVLDLLDDRGDLDRVAVNHADPAKIAVARELFAKYPPQRSAGSGLWRVIDGGGADWRAEIGDDALAAVAVDAEHLRLLRALRLRSYLCVPLQVRGRVIGALTLVFAESGRQYREADVTLAKDIARRAATAVENARLFERLRTEDRRKDEFLATLAHELRNPLAPIRNGLDIIKRKGNGPETARTRDVMERQLSHLIRLVDDLLDVSRVTQGKVNLHREQVDLQTVVGTALEAVRSAVDAAGLALEVRLPPTPLVLEADRTRIAQVLCNLLNNAAKYTEPGGQVVVAGALVGEEVEISVADTGIGIPPELLGQVFEMFAQVGSSLERSQGGLGIGLTLVRRLVDLHGGRVWAESDGPGRGSRFVVRLPRAAPGPETAPGVAALAPARSGQLGRRVLVVDDNDDAAETLAEILRFDGHEVTTAASGPAALSAVVRFRPDVALLDIGMPGMSGYELARRLRADPRLSSTVLVALTGWGQDKDRRESQEAGFAQHLTKPVDLDRLRQIVEAAERLRD